MGLGAVENSNSIYLSIAGGFIWNRKAEKDDPNYSEQVWKDKEGNDRVRKGAKYGTLTGNLTKVEFRTHSEYGDNINVTIESEGQNYILSIGLNNRNSQDLMKALLKIDVNKPIKVKPYDFIGSDKKRAHGISFSQDGKKVDLKTDYPDEFQKEKGFFTSAPKKQIRRYFEDLSDWFRGEIEEKIIPQLDKKSESKPTQDKPAKVAENDEPKVSEKPSETQQSSKPKEKVEEKLPTVLKMKQYLKGYIKENYEDKELPKLSKDEVVQWYKLAKDFEELPFKEEATESNEMSQDELDAELEKLANL